MHIKTVDLINKTSSDLRDVADRSTAQGNSIGWNEAAELLLKRNPQILRAKLQQARLKKERKGYWKNYVPGIRASASLAKNIGQFDDLKLSDFNVYAFLNLRVPNPITIRGELLALSLSEYRSARSYELIKRQKLAALYREFLSYEEFRLTYENGMDALDDGVEMSSASELITRIRKANETSAQRMRLRKSMNQISFRVSQMLQVTDYKIRPQVEKLPNIDYSKNYSRLESSDNYGRLALQILAADLEAAGLKHRSVRLARWPRINLGASAPQVYSSDANADFDIDSVRLFGGLTKGFDVFDNKEDRLELSKKDYEQVKSDAHYRVVSERETLRQSLKQYSELLKKKRSLEIAWQLNRDLIESGIAAERMVQAIEKQQQISRQLKSINRSINNQELEFWIWDERAWK